MKTFRLVVIALAITCLFGINNSAAIQVELTAPMNSNNEGYDYGAPYFTFYAETDKPYDRLVWYVYYYETKEFRKIGSIDGDGVSTYHHFSINLPGVPKGTKYTISVLAMKKVRIGDREWMSFAVDNYNLRVFKITDAPNNGTGRRTGASGYATIYRHYHDGEDIVMDSYAYAYNPGGNPKAKDPNDNPLRVSAWFRVLEYLGFNRNAKDPEHGRDTKAEEIIKVGNSSQSYSPDHAIVGVQLGGWIKRNQRLYYDAHTHLTVSTTKGKS